MKAIQKTIQMQTVRLAKSYQTESGVWVNAKLGSSKASGSWERFWVEKRGDVLLFYPASQMISQYGAYLERRSENIPVDGLQAEIESQRDTMTEKQYAAYMSRFAEKVSHDILSFFLLGLSIMAASRSTLTLSFEGQGAKTHPSNKSLEMTFDTAAAFLTWRDILETLPELSDKTLSDFSVVKHIGYGATSNVFLVRDRYTQEKTAMKVIEKKDVFHSEGSARRAIDERLIYGRMKNHPYILELRHAFESVDRLYVATEYCSHGDLFHYTKSGNILSETQARIVAAEILLVLETLHYQGIWYRDLKPENVFVTDSGHVKLGDFGAAKIVPKSEPFTRTKSTVGTPEYLAPEMVNQRPYNRAVDLWAYGVFVCELLNGETPFGGENEWETFDRIANWPVGLPITMPHKARDLVTKILQRKPGDRLGTGLQGWEDIKKHPWFEGIDWDMMLLCPTPVGPLVSPQKKIEEPPLAGKYIERSALALEHFAEDLKTDIAYANAVRGMSGSEQLPPHPLSGGKGRQVVLGGFVCRDGSNSESLASLEPLEPLSVPTISPNGEISFVTLSGTQEQGARKRPRLPWLKKLSQFWKNVTSFTRSRT